MKDFERITYVIALFDFESESKIENVLCQSILSELKNRVDDIIQYPRCFPLCLHYLTQKGYHDEELLNAVLSRSFLDWAYGNPFKYGKELFGLDSYAKINLKRTYEGNELTEKTRRYMGKILTQYVPDRSGKFKTSASGIILLEIKDALDELCNHSYFAHPLPHFDRPGKCSFSNSYNESVFHFSNAFFTDIIIAYDKTTGNGVNIAHNFPDLYTGQIIDRSMLVNNLDLDKSNVEVIHLIAGARNCYVRDTYKLNGLTKMKIDQSKVVGFQPALVILDCNIDMVV